MQLPSRILLLLLLASGTFSLADETNSSNSPQPGTEGLLDLTEVSTANPGAALNISEETLEDDQQKMTSSTSDKPSVPTIIREMQNPCILSPDPGPCTAEQVRFFFDAKSKRCRQFIYGGCEGNENQFTAEEDCLKTCVTAAEPIEHHRHEDHAPLSVGSPGRMDDAATQDMLTLTNGNGETSFTFAAEYPFIQLTAADIVGFNIRLYNILYLLVFVMSHMLIIVVVPFFILSSNQVTSYKC